MAEGNGLNVLYFITHDTGRFLGCYDRPIPWSPNLDQFARRGVRFDRTYCSAPCCGPSRNCAMTGKYSHVTGTLGLGGMGWCLPEEEPTLVDHFNRAGYETVHMGFCHERRYGEMRYRVDGSREDETLWQDAAEIVVDNAIGYLRNRDTSRPFYMNLATGETHAGHTGKERHGGPVPEDQVWVPPTVPDLPEIRRYLADWYSGLRYLDDQFGRLMSAVEELGLLETTLIVFTTDHGVSGQRSKGHLYEPGVEISLLVRPPGGMRRGYAVDCLIPNIDFMPTWLEAAGLPVPDGVNGRSFWGLLAGGDYAPREQIFMERNFHGERPSRYSTDFIDKYDPQRAVRTGDLHYVRHFRPDARPRPWYRHEIEGWEDIEGHKLGSPLPIECEPRPAEELYDTRHDPWEQVNLAGRPEYGERKRELADQLERWMRATEDPALSDEMPEPLEEAARWPTRDRVVEVERR